MIRHNPAPPCMTSLLGIQRVNDGMFCFPIAGIMLPVAVFAVTLCLSGVLSAPTRNMNLDDVWTQWKNFHSKSYHEVGGAWLPLL